MGIKHINTSMPICNSVSLSGEGLGVRPGVRPLLFNIDRNHHLGAVGVVGDNQYAWAGF